jgi:hypothetical protein
MHPPAPTYKIITLPIFYWIINLTIDEISTINSFTKFDIKTFLKVRTKIIREKKTRLLSKSHSFIKISRLITIKKILLKESLNYM